MDQIPDKPNIPDNTGTIHFIAAHGHSSFVKATFDGRWVWLGREGHALYEQSGYGRCQKDRLRLAPEEALYLLHRARIGLAGYSFDALLSIFAEDPNFLRRFLVYRDIRERGYAIQTGPHDFRVFRRGQRPSTGQSQYMVRVLSERDLIDFAVLVQEISVSINMRKQHVLAVVDDENELTYYEVKFQGLPDTGVESPSDHFHADMVGKSAIVQISPDSSEFINSFGMQLDASRIVLSPLEAVYLMHAGCLELLKDHEIIDADQYFECVSAIDVEMHEKTQVYEDLRNRGYIPRTGYKFGHHFRVYSGKKVHSEMLVHAIAPEVTMPMSTISRSVRLAHSVKKKMLFGCVNSTGIQYIEFARIKL